MRRHAALSPQRILTDYEAAWHDYNSALTQWFRCPKPEPREVREALMAARARFLEVAPIAIRLNSL